MIWPFIVLLIGIAVVVFLIVGLRLHAFLSLMIAAVVVGLLSAELPGTDTVSKLIQAVELPMREFGTVAGQIGFVIALAAIIGAAMLESGAADKIVNSLVNLLGESRAPIALILSSLILGIPVFFDTVFFLMIPLAQAMYLRTGARYVFFIMAIAGGAAITHHMVPPTPGPLIMAETLQVDLGVTIMAGLLSAILPGLVVYFLGRRVDARLSIPYRSPGDQKTDSNQPLNETYSPGLSLSLLPVVLPVFLISLATVMNLIYGDSTPELIGFLGNKNLAMFLGTCIALWLWARHKGWRIRDLGDAVGEPLQIAGVIILITCAGGAFGAMIRHAGIGEAVEWATSGFEVNYILLAWLIAAVMKIAQGSGTVSMITTSGIMVAIIGDGSALAYHPVYILLAIGFGAMFVSWMNDSGFWVVAKMSGFSERETLQTWSFVLAAMGVVGLVQTMLMAMIMPF